MTPNPRVVSRELLTRDSFQPATSPEHARGGLDPVHDPRLVQPRQRRQGATLESRCRPATTARRIRCSSRAPPPTRRGRRMTGSAPPTHVNLETPLVGRLADLPDRRTLQSSVAHRATAANCSMVRPGRRRAARRRPLLDAARPAGRAGGSASACCSRCSRASTTPSATDWRARVPRLVGRASSSRQARLINAALMAKIHTVEWTPAIIAHPDDGYRHARQLVGRRRREAAPHLRAAHRQRGHQRHSRLADEPSRARRTR